MIYDDSPPTLCRTVVVESGIHESDIYGCLTGARLRGVFRLHLMLFPSAILYIQSTIPLG